MNYGDSIKNARKKAGLTQKELAEKAGLAEITIRQYETNKREPRSENLKKIAAALEIPVDDLLGGLFFSKVQAIFDQWEKEGIYSPPDELNSDNFRCLDEEYIISLVKQLNNTGLGRIYEHLEDLLKISEYRKDTCPDPESDEEDET